MVLSLNLILELVVFNFPLMRSKSTWASITITVLPNLPRISGIFNLSEDLNCDSMWTSYHISGEPPANKRDKTIVSLYLIFVCSACGIVVKYYIIY